MKSPTTAAELYAMTCALLDKATSGDHDATQKLNELFTDLARKVNEHAAFVHACETWDKARKDCGISMYDWATAADNAIRAAFEASQK
jgi:hypothetical protein